MDTSRRRLLHLRALVPAVVVLAVAAGLTSGPPGAVPASSGSVAADTRPNIVIVLTDDQRKGTIRPELMPQLWTQIRAQGRAYPNASVPTSLCCPSRASILTGNFAHTTRIYSNDLPNGGWQLFHDLGEENNTIATALHAAGYDTSLVGKYLNGPFWAALANGYEPPGWDHVISFTSTGDHYYDYTLNDGSAHGEAPGDYSTDVLAGYAESFIRSAPRDAPLFLYFAPVAPHRPFTASPTYAGTWHGRLPSYQPDQSVADKPVWIRDLTKVSQTTIDDNLASAQESLLSVDDAVGGLVTALTDAGRMDNTLFIYLSDNGLMEGEHRLLWKNLPYRWATSIPLVVRWDGRVAPDSTDRRFALNVDLAQTISNATGLGLHTEGLDMFGVARRTGFPLEGGKWFTFDSPPKHPAYCGYRTKRWMFAQYANGARELYDYDHDPDELNNLAHNQAYLNKMRPLRDLAMATCRPVPPGFSW